MLSLHSSPLAQPGAGDGGGMSVYVRALGSALARAGLDVDVLARADHADVPTEVSVEDRFRVVNLDAGPRRTVDRRELFELTEDLVAAARSHLVSAPADVLHANYWMSGAVAHRLKHELALPMIATFHTLALVKADAGFLDEHDVRLKTEHDIVRCSDLVLASTGDERAGLVERYGAPAERVEVLPPGVDHGVFSPGDRAAARLELGLDGRRVLLFVGRIQPLKGADVAVRALAELADPSAVLVIVGGPSGADGVGELRRLHDLVADLGLEDRVRFVAPQPHHGLPVFYRAADVCVVPSRTESFGLVALEAAACGTPVVAADVGGLRTLIRHGETGFLVRSRSASDMARAVENVLAFPAAAASMGEHAAAHASAFTWTLAAARLRRLVADLDARALVECR